MTQRLLRFSTIVAATLAIQLVIACVASPSDGTQPAPTPAATVRSEPEATATAIPATATARPAPSRTPVPSPTATLAPTATEAPATATELPVPTDTPVPTLAPSPTEAATLAPAATAEESQPSYAPIDPTPTPIAIVAKPPNGLTMIAKPNDALTELSLLPVDPRTLADRTDVKPVPVGRHYQLATSPDGQSVAVVAWPRDAFDVGQLKIITTRDWSSEDSGVNINGSVSMLSFTPDSTTIYWIQSTSIDPATQLARDFVLYRFRLTTGLPTQVIRLPKGFDPQLSHFAPDGTTLSIYGYPTDVDSLATGAPKVLVIDLQTDRMASEVQLDVKAGRTKAIDAVGEHYETSLPGLAWDDSRRLLYAIDPERQTMSVVDLAAGAVARDVEIQNSFSWSERAMNLFVKYAAAGSSGEMRVRQAVLSADRSKLFVSSTHFQDRPRGNEIEQVADSMGLSVIDTTDGRVILEFREAASDPVLSPDGAWLLYSNPPVLPGETSLADPTMSRIVGIRLDTLQAFELTQHAPHQLHHVLGFTPSGEQAYVEITDENGLTPRVTIQLIDLASAAVMAERPLGSSFFELGN